MQRRDCLKLAAVGCAHLLGGCRASRDTSTSQPPGEDAHTSLAGRRLGEHRIAKIETRWLHDRFPRMVGANAKLKPVGRGGRYQIGIITTDQSAAGWAMCHAEHDELQQFVGTRISDLFDLEQGASEAAQPLELVLYDLVGHILQRAVWKMLGAHGPRVIPLYSGAIYFDDLLPVDKPRGIAGVLASCQQDYDVGYRAFKLKIGRGFKHMPRQQGLRRDIEITRAVREHFQDCRILVDANDGYTVDEMIGYVQAVADCGLYWIEEPFRENRPKLKKLRDHMAKTGCRALIADGEYRVTKAWPMTRYGGYTQEFIDRLYELAAEKLVDVFVLDLGIVGYTRWRRVMPELVRAGVLASPHTWAWSPRTYYAAHLAAGVGNVPVVEGIPARAEGIDYGAYTMEKGNLLMPNSPGFGLELSF